MEFSRDLDKRSPVVNELVQGHELAKQLQKLIDSSSSSSPETREFLIHRILSINNKVLDLVTSNGNPLPPNTSRSSLCEHQPAPSKKRKILPRRAEKVKLMSGEELPSDGYSWRKYGQKIILGAKFRRKYFRCSHRDSQGCRALKQVQKSDEDPTILHVIYVGHHTCTQSIHVIHPSATTSPPRVQPKLTVQTEELNNACNHEKFFFRSISFSALYVDSPTNVNGETTTPDSVLWEGFFAQNSGENSPINEREFTLEELGIIDPNFPFNYPDMFH